MFWTSEKLLEMIKNSGHTPWYVEKKEIKAWECPKCGNVYSEYVLECKKCNKK